MKAQWSTYWSTTQPPRDAMQRRKALLKKESSQQTRMRRKNPTIHYHLIALHQPWLDLLLTTSLLSIPEVQHKRQPNKVEFQMFSRCQNVPKARSPTKRKTIPTSRGCHLCSEKPQLPKRKECQKAAEEKLSPKTETSNRPVVPRPDLAVDANLVTLWMAVYLTSFGMLLKVPRSAPCFQRKEPPCGLLP